MNSQSMGNSKDLIQQVAREIEASPTTSPTAAGPTEARQPPSESQVDAINQVFALFRLNYHNQFYAAYPDNEQLNQAKKLWLEALYDYPVEQVLRGAKHAIEHSEYLPTLSRMLNSCQEALRDLGLPDARSAYREACQARSPKSAQAWSHPAVYLAGSDCGWFLLASEPETTSWPAFQQAYSAQCRRVMAGERLEIPAPAALEQEHGSVSDREEALAEVEKLKALLAAPGD